MSLGDRIGRSVFVALAVGLAWGIRGDFGHLVGAMYPGAILALAFAYVSGQRSLFQWMPVLAALSALAIGLGGHMSYGILHGYAQSDTLVNYTYGFLTLFLQGSAWGTFGGALIGLLLERERVRTGEWLGYLGSILMGAWVSYFLVVTVFDFHINPPRSDSSIAYFGAAIGQFAWLALNRRYVGLRGAFFAYIGFGLGMSAGRLLGNLANDLQASGMTINHWNVMETSCGFIAGLIFCFGMVNQTYPDPPRDKEFDLVSVYGIFFTLGMLPLWHRVGRFVTSEKISEWTKTLQEYGYADPELLANRLMLVLNGICVLGFVGAAIWMVIHSKRLQRFSAFPVLWLSGTMLLYQNVNALYFLYPADWKRVNMHGVFWVLFLAMIVYVIVKRPYPSPVLEPMDDSSPESISSGEVSSQPVSWGGWILGSIGAFGLVILVASVVNGPRTMKSANTRWPLWTWSSGPFPGTQPAAKSAEPKVGGGAR